MYFCIAGLCAGIALVAAFPNQSPLAFAGTLLFAGSALALLVLFVLSLVRSIRSRSPQGPQLLAGGILLVLAIFVFHRVAVPSTESRIERTIGTVATSGNPAYCDELVTDRYLEQTTDEEMPFADEACESEAGQEHANSVEVSEIAVDGNRATALVTNSGGSLDGSQVVVRLLEEDDQWKLDRLVRFARFDRARFRLAYRHRLRSIGFPADAIGCILGKELRFPNDAIEREALQPDHHIFAGIVVGCDRPAVERNVIGAIADPRLDFPEAAIECGRRRLAAATDAELMRVQLSAAAYTELLLSCGRDAFLAYQRRELAAGDRLGPTAVACVLAVMQGLPDTSLIRVAYDADRYEAIVDGCEAQA
jgi:hypothetical protein